MKKCLVRLLIGIGILTTSLSTCSTISSVAADKGLDVELSVITEEIYGDVADVVVNVNFENPKLYNNQVFLSYHIEDMVGNVLLYENERYSVILDENNSSEISIKLDLNSALSLSNEDELTIKFDLVDQRNLYWFSEQDAVNFDDAEIKWHIRGNQILLKELSNELANHKVIFTLNMAVLVGVIFLVVYTKTRKER